jgi:hypothetical protein
MTGFRFDDARAGTYVPVRREVTAILVVPSQDTVAIETSFGTQVLRGPFYVVADGDSSYGAAKREFEATHEKLGPTSWAKSAPVRAYQVAEPCTVTTRLDDHDEGTVDAAPGDWVVRQATGEVMVLHPTAFAQRYAPADRPR